MRLMRSRRPQPVCRKILRLPPESNAMGKIQAKNLNCIRNVTLISARPGTGAVIVEGLKSPRGPPTRPKCEPQKA